MRCYSIGFHVGLPKGLKQLLEKHLSGILCLDGQDPFAYTTHTFIYIYIYIYICLDHTRAVQYCT